MGGSHNSLQMKEHVLCEEDCCQERIHRVNGLLIQLQSIYLIYKSLCRPFGLEENCFAVLTMPVYTPIRVLMRLCALSLPAASYDLVSSLAHTFIQPIFIEHLRCTW